MKRLFESWRRFINEVEFHDSPDEDTPGKKQIVVFSQDDAYNVEGSTHGGVSHTIKHYIEFDREGMIAGLKQALEQARQSDNFFLKDVKSGNIIATGDEAKKAANENAMLNTFDLINDKIKNGVALGAEETQLKSIIGKLDQQYQKLIESYMSSATDIEGIQDASKIKQILDAGKIIKFMGAYKGTPVQYYLNTSNTGLVAQSGGKIATLFRIDKSGNNLAKVAKYFKRGVELKNPAFAEALASYGGGEQDQQQKKKQKPQQQQKKGPNVRAMAMGMQRGGKSFEEIQAQIKKSTGRDIPIDNIKRMVGA